MFKQHLSSRRIRTAMSSRASFLKNALFNDIIEGKIKTKEELQAFETKIPANVRQVELQIQLNQVDEEGNTIFYHLAVKIADAKDEQTKKQTMELLEYLIDKNFKALAMRNNQSMSFIEAFLFYCYQKDPVKMPGFQTVLKIYLEKLKKILADNQATPVIAGIDSFAQAKLMVEQYSPLIQDNWREGKTNLVFAFILQADSFADIYWSENRRTNINYWMACMYAALASPPEVHTFIIGIERLEALITDSQDYYAKRLSDAYSLAAQALLEINTDFSVNLAVQYLQKAAENFKSPAACLVLGRIYNTDQFGKKDILKASHWFQQALDYASTQDVPDVAWQARGELLCTQSLLPEEAKLESEVIEFTLTTNEKYLAKVQENLDRIKDCFDQYDEISDVITVVEEIIKSGFRKEIIPAYLN